MAWLNKVGTVGYLIADNPLKEIHTMPSKLLLALMSAAFAVSATNVYAEDQTKTEAPQAQQIVAEGEKEGEKADLIASAPDWRGDETLDLIA